MIEEVKLKLYSDSALSHLEAEFTAEGTTSPQTIEMFGLDSNTQYFAVAYATDNNGVTGQSEPRQFRTLEAAVTVEGEVDYTMNYNELKYIVSYSDGDNYTLMAKGVEFSTVMDFNSEVQTFVYPSGVTGWQNASPFGAHTMYYYRFFAEFAEIGRVYGQPINNTITTMYAPPQFIITTGEITENTAEITISYTGDYPIDYNSLQGSVVGYTGDVITLQLDALTPEHPEIVTLSGLNANTIYEVEVWMNYYTTTAEAYATFTTAEAIVHNYDIQLSPVYNVDYHIIDFDVTATKLVFDRLTPVNIGIDICAVPDFSGHQLGGELGSGALSFTWEAMGLNEHRRYFCRPWIETREYGREYGETKIVESHWNIPEITITQAETGWDMVLLDVKYNGGLPVPSNGVIKIYSYDMQTVVKTVDASNLVWNGTRQILVTGLQVHNGYNAVYEGAYYSFGNLVNGSAEIHTASERMTMTRTESWAQNGQHTDVITIDVYFGDTIENVSFLYPLGINIVSQTVEDNVYTIVTEGYSYGNPYQFVADVTLGGGYTESKQYNITVPSQNMHIYTVNNTYKAGGLSFADTLRANMAGTGYIYYDLEETHTEIILESTTTGTEYRFFLSEVTHYQGTSGHTLYFYFDTIPADTYNVSLSITNVFGQNSVQSMPNTITQGATRGSISLNSNTNELFASIGYNRYYTALSPTKKIEVSAGGTTTNTMTVTPQERAETQYYAKAYVYNGTILANVQKGILYTIRVFYTDTDYNVYTYVNGDIIPEYSITSVSNITDTTARINISIN